MLWERDAINPLLLFSLILIWMSDTRQIKNSNIKWCFGLKTTHVEYKTCCLFSSFQNHFLLISLSLSLSLSLIIIVTVTENLQLIVIANSELDNAKFILGRLPKSYTIYLSKLGYMPIFLRQLELLCGDSGLEQQINHNHWWLLSFESEPLWPSE